VGINGDIHMDITLTHILLFFLIISVSYLAYTIAKINKQNNMTRPTYLTQEDMQKAIDYGNQEYIKMHIMHIPEAPQYIPDEIVTVYDNELDDIDKKLEILPSTMTIEERRILNSRYDELIGLIVNRFREKTENIEMNDKLTSSKKDIKGDNRAN
jgi:hypothetical protein